ncbi:MAG: M48 family metalloprotease [Bryobacteraceae bacterium]
MKYEILAVALFAAGALLAQPAAINPRAHAPLGAPDPLSNVPPLGNSAGIADPRGVEGRPDRSNDQLVDQLLDRITDHERLFVESMQSRTPLIETYIQETAEGASSDDRPVRDHYFLGRFRLGAEIAYQALVERTDAPPQKASGRSLFRSSGPKQQALSFLPRGFAQMAVIDLHDFTRTTYTFEFVRREFLGEVRCLVLDVFPVDRNLPGKFIGRIWVEDRDFAIVRFNGTYVQAPTPKGAIPERYFHFDSWRVNTGGSSWVPAQIYVEEEGDDATAVDIKPPGAGKKASKSSDKSPPVRLTPHFKAQSRIWDYAASPASKLDELTSILIESENTVRDQASPKDVSPLESQRSWEKQAEDNLLSRLEKGGFLSPPGAVDQVLDTVVNNLIVSANLDIDAHCRVLLTTPIETFSIGHTVVISRGLIDVLPDETSLALVLAAELSHIALGHRTQTQFAFNNQTMLSDAELLQRFRFQRSADELTAAGKKTVELMRASPYQNTANAGLFLKALQSRMQALPRLLQANLGNQVANADALTRLADFSAKAPALEENKLEQIAALPLGSRVKVQPWRNQLELIKARPISLLSPREKMPFEVSPFVLYLTRVEKEAAREVSSNAAK